MGNIVILLDPISFYEYFFALFVCAVFLYHNFYEFEVERLSLSQWFFLVFDFNLGLHHFATWDRSYLFLILILILTWWLFFEYQRS